MSRLLDMLPRGYTLDEAEWQRRHRLLLWVLALHVPGLALFGFFSGFSPLTIGLVLITPAAATLLGRLLRHFRRTASVLVTFGLAWCSAALVGFSHGTIEAHFHFFIIIGFIAIYQDWAPFLMNIVFTVISHGIGSLWQQGLIFNDAAAQADPWKWSLIHGVAVLFACVGVTLFWRVTEESQQEKDRLARQLVETETEVGKRQFTSDLLSNLARRNQSLLHRQLDIINQLEESEQDPDALAELFALDHIATRVRRNAENLLVLSGEQTPRTWSAPVPLRDVLRAAIAETEDLSRVAVVVDEDAAVVGHAVTDLTHLLAELTENAVRFSPPDTTVTARSRPDGRNEGGWLLTVEDWGVGMPAADLAAANALLAEPPEVDLSIWQRLGFHVVARLAARHAIRVSLSATPGSGVTALVALPSALFARTPQAESVPLPRRDAGAHRTPAPGRPPAEPAGRGRPAPRREPVSAGARPAPGAGRPLTNGAGASTAVVVDHRAVESTLEVPAPRPGPHARPDDAPGPWVRPDDAPGPWVRPEDTEARLIADPSGWTGWWEAPAGERAGQHARPGVQAQPTAPSGSAAPSAQSPSAHSPSAYSPSAHSPSAHSPSAHSPSASSPSAHSPSALSPSALSPWTPPEAGAPLHPPSRPPAAAAPARPQPRPRPAPAPSGPAPAASGPATPDGLRRRVPQSHLAAPLRQAAEAERLPDRSGAERAALDAAQALSRYQAQRARAVHDGPDGNRR